MSTAVMPQNAIYEFGDILLKNGVNSSDSTSPAQLASTTTAAVRLSLARMVSSPAAPISSSANLAALIGNLTQQHHRRLERTQSAPAPASSAAAAAAAAAAAVNTSRYKTELCRPYEEFGVCKYGDKCQFAHGVAELRSLARHPKYKTELCRTYHTVGFCPYGPRCHFVHNQDEVIQHREQQHRSVSAAIMVNRSPPPHQHQPPSNQQQPRLRPSALSPSLSLDSPSPPSSLSQSPTSSMGSFFSSEPELHSPTATATIEEQRLPVFNRISAAPLLAFSDFLL